MKNFSKNKNKKKKSSSTGNQEVGIGDMIGEAYRGVVDYLNATKTSFESGRRKYGGVRKDKANHEGEESADEEESGRGYMKNLFKSKRKYKMRESELLSEENRGLLAENNNSTNGAVDDGGDRKSSNATNHMEFIRGESSSSLPNMMKSSVNVDATTEPRSSSGNIESHGATNTAGLTARPKNSLWNDWGTYANNAIHQSGASASSRAPDDDGDDGNLKSRQRLQFNHKVDNDSRKQFALESLQSSANKTIAKVEQDEIEATVVATRDNPFLSPRAQAVAAASPAAVAAQIASGEIAMTPRSSERQSSVNNLPISTGASVGAGAGEYKKTMPPTKETNVQPTFAESKGFRSDGVVGAGKTKPWKPSVMAAPTKGVSTPAAGANCTDTEERAPPTMQRKVLVDMTDELDSTRRTRASGNSGNSINNGNSMAQIEGPLKVTATTAKTAKTAKTPVPFEIGSTASLQAAAAAGVASLSAPASAATTTTTTTIATPLRHSSSPGRRPPPVGLLDMDKDMDIASNSKGNVSGTMMRQSDAPFAPRGKHVCTSVYVRLSYERLCMCVCVCVCVCSCASVYVRLCVQ
jgi:hypothetical protein